MTMVSGDVSGETVRPKRLSKASPLQIDRGCTRRRLGRRSLNVDISLFLVTFRSANIQRLGRRSQNVNI